MQSGEKGEKGGVERPLQGIRVLDLTHWVAGPYGSMLVADAGAEVIKIEPPGGEGGRHVEPFVTDVRGQKVSAYTWRFGRNKKALTLDLRKKRGRELFLQLVRVSDVVIENFRAKTLDKIDLGYEVLRRVNTGIIYASVSGYGHLDIYQGPYWNWPAYASVAHAMSGLTSLSGQS